jgi:hypothetical protein
MNRTGTTRNRLSNAGAAVTSHAIKAQVSTATSGKSSRTRNGKARQLYVIGLTLRYRVYAPKRGTPLSGHRERRRREMDHVEVTTLHALTPQGVRVAHYYTVAGERCCAPQQD